MRDGGKKTKLTEKVDSFTQMVMCMMASGRTIKPMDSVFTVI